MIGTQNQIHMHIQNLCQPKPGYLASDNLSLHQGVII